MKKLLLFAIVFIAKLTAQPNPAEFDIILGKGITFSKSYLGGNNYTLQNKVEDDDITSYLFVNDSKEDSFFSYYKGQAFLLAKSEILVTESKLLNKVISFNYNIMISGCYGDCSNYALLIVKNKVDHSIKPLPENRKDRKSYILPSSIHRYNNDVGKLEEYTWDNDNILRELSLHNWASTSKPLAFKTSSKIDWVNYKSYDKSLMDKIREPFNPLNDYDLYSIPSNKPQDYVDLYLMDIVYNVYNKNENIKLEVNSFNRNVYFKDIVDKDDKPDYHTLAIAHKMFDDCGIEIQIDTNNWNIADPLKRLWIMYHELSHDAFNIQHNYGGDIMKPYLPQNISESYFQTERKKLLTYLKNLNFKANCSDLNKFLPTRKTEKNRDH